MHAEGLPFNQLLPGGKYILRPRLLGEGSISRVYSGKGVREDDSFAIKIIDTNMSEPDILKNVYEEIEILKKLHAKGVSNAVRVFDTVQDEEKHQLYIVLELLTSKPVALDSELAQMFLETEAQLKGKKLTRSSALTFKKFKHSFIRQVIKQTVGALQACNKAGTFHGNLSPEHIYLDARGNVKLTGFSSSTSFQEDIDMMILKRNCSKCFYAAPEVLQSIGHNFLCDIWSLGVITYRLLSNGALHFPFNGSSFHTDLFKELPEFYETFVLNFYPEQLWKFINSNAKDFVSYLLVVNIADRSSYNAILTHPWLTNESKDFDINALGKFGNSDNIASDEITDSYFQEENNISVSLDFDNLSKSEVKVTVGAANDEDSEKFDYLDISLTVDSEESTPSIDQNSSENIDKEVGTEENLAVAARELMLKNKVRVAVDQLVIGKRLKNKFEEVSRKSLLNEDTQEKDATTKKKKDRENRGENLNGFKAGIYSGLDGALHFVSEDMNSDKSN